MLELWLRSLVNIGGLDRDDSGVLHDTAASSTSGVIVSNFGLASNTALRQAGVSDVEGERATSNLL